MKDLVKKAGLETQFHIESATTSTEEIGNPVHPPVRRKLAEHGIDCAGKTARQLVNSDYDKYNLLIGMDQANLQNMHRICGGDFANKLHLLMDYAPRTIEVSRRLAGNYEATAHRLGIAFVDAGTWGVGLAYDGVHFSEEGHQAFAKGMRTALDTLL